MRNPISDSPLRGITEMETGGHNDNLIRSKLINYRIVDQDTLSDYVSDNWAVEGYWPGVDDEGEIISWRRGFDGNFWEDDPRQEIKSTAAAYPWRQRNWGFRIVRNR